jgi:acetyl-CoA acyltransferase 1
LQQVDYIDPKTGVKSRIVVDTDEGIREGVTKESLGKLKPAFFSHGSTHAGNASQITDGAAALLITRRSVAKKLGLNVVAKFVTIGLAGVPVDIMG